MEKNKIMSGNLLLYFGCSFAVWAVTVFLLNIKYNYEDLESKELVFVWGGQFQRMKEDVFLSKKMVECINFW